LRSGDRITVVDGHDRREPLVRRVVRVTGGMANNPQFTVSRTPGEQVIVNGSLSHELVSVRFRPSGPARPARAVALTFDDGPSPKYTPRILAALTKLRARATFFVIGYLAEANPDLVREELRLGMTVGNHSYNHPEVPPFAQLPPQLLTDEIALGEQVLSRLGARPHLFRPPGGSTTRPTGRPLVGRPGRLEPRQLRKRDRQARPLSRAARFHRDPPRRWRRPLCHPRRPARDRARHPAAGATTGRSERQPARSTRTDRQPVSSQRRPRPGSAGKPKKKTATSPLWLSPFRQNATAKS